MMAQQVWAEAEATVGFETMSKCEKGVTAMVPAFNRCGKMPRMCLLALILLMTVALPLHAVTRNLAAGGDLEDMVLNIAGPGDVLILDGDPLPIVNTIPIDKAITIQGYDSNPCELLPTDRVIGGDPDDCSINPVLNPDFELGDQDWTYTPTLTANTDPAYLPPTSSDIITQEGEPEEGTWHAKFEVDPRGAEVQLDYDTPIPTLPATIREEVQWTTSATNLCNIMDLTTESAYTLPVLPPTLIENFRTNAFPVTLLSNHFHLWLRVLQYSGHPDDKIEVFISGVPVATADTVDLTAWETPGNWERWHIALAPALPVAPADVRIQVTTRTDVANPTLVLIGAVNINDTLTPVAVDGVDSVNSFDYTSNLGAVETLAKSIIDVTTDVDGTMQDFVARAGGLGTPYIAANMRTDAPVLPGTDAVKLMFDTHEFGDIPLSALPVVPAACGRYVFPLPPHLMNIPGRPRIRVSLTPAGAVARVLVDDFTLSYVTPALEAAYPEIAAAANIIPNGDFENGTYPFLIESPIATPVNCPHISDVILPSAGACSGANAAEFKPMLDLVLWLRCPQSSGLNTDIIEVIIRDSSNALTTIGVVDTTTLGAGWEIVSFPFIPATIDFTVILRSRIQTNTAMPTMVLLGAMDIQFGPPLATALPSPSARKISDMVAADTALVTMIPVSITIGIDLPPMILNAPTVALPGETQVLRFGGLGTTVKFQLKRLAGPGLGSSTLTVPIAGGTDWVIDDGAMSASCRLEMVTPDHFPPNTDIDLSFVSSILPNPIEATEFFVDDVCVSYLALENTAAMDMLATALGLGVPCDRNQILEGDFEASPLNEWSVQPSPAIDIDDVVKAAAPCVGLLPNRAAVFSGIENDVPVWELSLEQDIGVLPLLPNPLELKFRLNTLSDGGATPGEFRVEIDKGTPTTVFTRLSDASGSGGYNEYSVDITAFRGPPAATIRFVATLPRSVTPPAFALDNIEVCESGHLGAALFRVEAGGVLTLQSVTLEQANIGVEVIDGTLNLFQSKIRNMDGAAAIEAVGGDTLVVSSVLHGNRDNGIHVNGGAALVLQSTIRENGGAGVLVDGGTAYVAASLLDGNGQGIAVTAPGTATSYVNWVENNDIPPAAATAGFADLNATTSTPDYSDSPWKGKLNTPLMPAPDEPTLELLITRILADSGFPDAGSWKRDFECNLRPSFEKAQVGADHVDPTPVLCPVDSLGADQGPHDPPNSGTVHSSNNATYVMEQTPSVQYGSISYITWWGIWRDSGGTPCTPPTNITPFEIATYDGPGGAQTALELVIPTATPLPGYDYGGAPLYKFQHAFDRDIISRDQYLSIRAIVIPADDCYFHWISSADGSDAAVDAAGNPINVNLSLCISEYSTSDECSGGSLTTQQPPVHFSEPGTPFVQSTTTSAVYERVSETQAIGFIEFWGIWLSNDTVPTACDAPMNANLEIKYVENMANLGSAIDTDIITPPGRLLLPDSEVTASSFMAPDGTLAPLYRYAFTPTGAFNLTNGWLSVQQDDSTDPACRFYWVTSNFGGNAAVTWAGPGNAAAPTGKSMSLCLGLGIGPATIGNCDASPDPLGKDQTGTFTMTGTNLMSLTTVLLVPEMAQFGVPGDENNTSLHVDLLTSPMLERITYSGEFGTTMNVRIRPSGPFNLSADGTLICTDGFARFVAIDEGGNTEPCGGGKNDLVIDTIEPELVTLNYANIGTVTNPLYCNANSGSPLISANRVQAIGTPGNWVPSLALPIVPKNNSINLANEDMHVYLNADSQFLVPFSIAPPPVNPLTVSLTAYFVDRVPNDGVNSYPVQFGGFVPATVTQDPLSPYELPIAATRGTARWNGTEMGWMNIGTGTFVPMASVPAVGQDMQAVWSNVQFGYTVEPWRTTFKLEAVDMAGNRTDPDISNSITLHWLYRTRAKFQTEPDMSVENPEIYWRLDRSFPDLPDSKPECAPLAMFRLYTITPPTPFGLLAEVGATNWRMDTLRGSTSFGTASLQQLLDQYQGYKMCLAIFGADETGNVQYGNNLVFDGLDTTALEGAEVNHFVWDNGERRTPNLAVDTSIRVELYHEKESNQGLRYRNYGTAQRVPLPPFAEACDTRVNADVSMRGLLPTADEQLVGVSAKLLLWKLYKEGSLVGRGTVPMANDSSLTPPYYFDADGTVSFNLMELLNHCTFVATVAELSDYAGNIFETNAGECLNPALFLARPHIGCGLFGDFFDYRIGDEGNPPLPANPNAPSERRREIRYTLTAQSVVVYRYNDPYTGTLVEDVVIDASPATKNFSIYVREVEEQVRDETPVREFGR